MEKDLSKAIIPISKSKVKSGMSESQGNENYQCKICFGTDNLDTNPLLSPCSCIGSMKFIHLQCMKEWL